MSKSTKFVWSLLLVATLASTSACAPAKNSAADSSASNSGQNGDGVVGVIDKTEPVAKTDKADKAETGDKYTADPTSTATDAAAPDSKALPPSDKAQTPSTASPAITANEVVDDQAADKVARAKLATLTPKQKLGQVFMVGFTDQADAESLIRDYNVGSFILMRRNDIGASLKLVLTALQTSAKPANGSGLLVATDQEGGIVQRLKNGFPTLPSARDAASRPDLTAYAKSVSQDLMAVGVNMNLAPVLDVDYPPGSALGHRAFATVSYTVFIATTQWLGGAKQSGIISTLKHYPGLGSSKVDSHYDLPVVDKDLATLLAQDIYPFKENITKGLADAIMVGAVSFPKIESSGLPASLSKKLVQDVLRTQLNYDGLVMTDDAGMGALKRTYTDEQVVTLAINAGVDVVLCVSQDEPPSCTRQQFINMYRALERALRNGTVSQDSLDRAVLRVLRLKAKHGLI